MTDYITLADKTKIPLDEWYGMRSQHQTKVINRANRRVAKWEEFKALRIKHPDWPSQKLLKNIKQMHWTDLRDFKILYPDYDWKGLEKINYLEIAKGRSQKPVYQGKPVIDWAHELGVNKAVVYYHLRKHRHLNNLIKKVSK